VFSIDGDGIWNACTTNVITKYCDHTVPNRLQEPVTPAHDQPRYVTRAARCAAVAAPAFSWAAVRWQLFAGQPIVGQLIVRQLID